LEGINDLVNFEADNVTDLETGFKEAVNDYLETCKELGKTPEKTYKGVFNVRVPSSIHKSIAMLAAEKGLKLNGKPIP
jgi:predicted HicB family RNase H-like nuclease